MALQTFDLDPNAQALTDNDVVDKINAATNQITRASSVAAAARPIEVGEVGAAEIADGSVSGTELSATAAKDNLKAMSDTAREFILTRPSSGQFPIISQWRTATGLLEVEYDDVAIP